LDIRITGKHIEITDEVKARIEEKVSGLTRFYSSVLDVEVIIEGEKDGQSNSVEVIARAKHNHTFVGKQTGAEIGRCADEAIEKVERQLVKQKQKERDNKHSSEVPKEIQ